MINRHGKLTRRKLLQAGLLMLGSSPSRAQLSTNTESINILQDWAFPGGVVVIQLPKTFSEAPTVRFGLHEPVITQGRNYWQVLLGLELDLLPGEYVLYVKIGDDEEPAFPVQITIRQQQYPLHSGAANESSRKLTLDTFSEIDFQNTVPPELPLRVPVAESWPDQFGTLWIDQRAEDSVTQQNCVALTASDVSSPGALAIVAPQNGIVTRIIPDASNNQIGTTICIDHGRELYSVIQGLQELTIEVGDGIVAGAVIGTSRLALPSKAPSSLIGGNNREESQGVSEILWQCILNGAAVNPLILTKVSA